MTHTVSSDNSTHCSSGSCGRPAMSACKGAWGVTNIDSSGAVIMLPTFGAAMRCVTTEPVSVPVPGCPKDREQACRSSLI